MIDHDFIREYIAERAAGASLAVPCHWIHGANDLDELDCDEGTNFCCECAEAKIAEFVAAHPDLADEISLDGGWGTDHDSAPFCDTCGAKLLGSLTDYGARCELEHFEDYHPRHCEELVLDLDKPPAPGDRIAWALIERCPGWTLVKEQTGAYALRMGHDGGQWVCVPEDRPERDGRIWWVEPIALWIWSARREKYDLVTVIATGLTREECTAERLRELANLFEFTEASRS